MGGMALSKTRTSISIAVIALWGLLPTGTKAVNTRPNILFIVLDDMNDWLGCYGGHPQVKSPNIDRLARRGVLLTNAHCVSPICGPSRASVLTGMRPETTGVYHNKGTYVDYVPDAVTFPEHFRTHGFRTLAAGKVNHGLGEPDPRLWDENGPDCGVLGTPFIDDELDTTSNKRLKQFVRWGRWKCVFPQSGDPMLFDYHGEFGISEQNDLADEHPEIIGAIREHIRRQAIASRRVVMPEPIR